MESRLKKKESDIELDEDFIYSNLYISSSSHELEAFEIFIFFFLNKIY